MKTGELLEQRRAGWNELEALCDRMQRHPRSFRSRGHDLVRMSSLYRDACSDLAMADVYQLPPTNVEYLHRLVGRAHNQIYRSQSFQFHRWWHTIFSEAPKQIFADPCVQVAAILFFGLFILAAWMASSEERFPGFARTILGEQIEAFETNFENPIERNLDHYVLAAAGYIQHNTGIGLKCFGFGPLILPTLFTLGYNAVVLGASFGYASRPEADFGDNFFHFVTAHGPFELTAIALSGGAGLRLGVGLLMTAGLRRIDSFKKQAIQSLPVILAAVVLFILAAFTEGFISPSPLPYPFKALWAIVSCGMMMFYFMMLGFPQQELVKYEGDRGRIDGT